MSAYLLSRLVKWVALLVLGHGLWAAVTGTDAGRVRAGLWVLPLALLGVFSAGYAMLEHLGMTLAEPWVSAALLLGVGSVGGAAWHVSQARSRLGAAVAVGGLFACMGVMVFRADVALGLALGLPGLLVGGVLAAEGPAADHAALKHWFGWIARAEGVSLLVLFGVAMPLKYGLDQPFLVSWGGWLHGVLFLGYLAALAVCVRRLRWSWVDAALGALASTVPFGTFWFERRIA